MFKKLKKNMKKNMKVNYKLTKNKILLKKKHLLIISLMDFDFIFSHF